MFQLGQFSLMALVMACCLSAKSQTVAPVKTTAEVTVESQQTDKIVADKKTTLNFEDELIEGTTQKPDLFYLFQKNNLKFKKLIRLRENFLPEMSRNAEDIQRLRGGR